MPRFFPNSEGRHRRQNDLRRNLLLRLEVYDDLEEDADDTFVATSYLDSAYKLFCNNIPSAVLGLYAILGLYIVYKEFISPESSCCHWMGPSEGQQQPSYLGVIKGSLLGFTKKDTSLGFTRDSSDGQHPSSYSDSTDEGFCPIPKL